MDSGSFVRPAPVYYYGAVESGFGPGNQPDEGFLYAQNDCTGLYYVILVYDRELSEPELSCYGLYPLGAE